MSLERRLGLKDGETFQAVVRAAPVTVLPLALVALALIFAPFFFLLPLLRWELLGRIIIGILLFVGLLVAGRLLVKWRMSLLALTDRRLIVIRQAGFFERDVTELPFSKMHEVSYRVKGFWPTLCRYGTIVIESAGSDRPIEMACVSDPNALKDLIIDLRDGAVGGPGEFGSMLQAVSRLDGRKLRLLKSEIERTMRLLPQEEDEG
jgi:membrane protein YdbS with pleckstrin-like domain